MKISSLATVSGLAVGFFIATVAMGDLIGDGARLPDWKKMPVLNHVESLHPTGGVFVSGLTNQDSIIKYCKGAAIVNVIGNNHQLKEIKETVEPFFLEADQTQYIHFEPVWKPTEKYYKGSFRVDLSCYGWNTSLPEPGAVIPFPETECQNSGIKACDLLCPATDGQISQCNLPETQMSFQVDTDLNYRSEGHLWKIGVNLDHNHEGEQALYCSFIVYLQAQKPGSTTMIEKQLKIPNKKVVKESRISGEVETLKNAYEINWNQTKVKGVCQKNRSEKPFEACHPGLRYECNYVN